MNIPAGTFKGCCILLILSVITVVFLSSAFCDSIYQWKKVIQDEMLLRSIMLSLVIASATSEAEPSSASPAQRDNHAALTDFFQHYQLHMARTATIVLGLGAVFLLGLYLPALVYRVCYVLGGCRPVGRDDLIAHLLSTARDMRVRNKRFAEPILANLTKGHAKYAGGNYWTRVSKK